MLFSEIVSYCLNRSGQFITGELSELNLTMEQVWYTLDQDIQNYERFFPLIKKYNIVIHTSPSGACTYDYTADPNNPGIFTLLPAPQLVLNGDQGSTLYGYQVFGLDEYGNVMAATMCTSTSLGAFTLTSTDSITLSWAPMMDAVSYAVYRFVTAGGTNTTGKIWEGTTNTMTDTGLVGDRTKLPHVLGNMPERITKIVPVGFRQNMTNWNTFKRQRGFPGQMGRVPTPRLIRPDWRAPILYMSEPGQMDIEATYKRYRRFTYDTQGKLLDVDIQDLEGEKTLLDILYAQFLIMLGNLFTAFDHTDMPITTNGAALVEQGNDMYKAALELMYDRKDISRAFRL